MSGGVQNTYPWSIARTQYIHISVALNLQMSSVFFQCTDGYEFFIYTSQEALHLNLVGVILQMHFRLCMI